ncbi:MAG: type I restriction endonuclease subunit R [Caldilinea sp.]|nr:type I restriction endonuclease subunit R [Caldilineaceae bacterium]MCO5211115.1 type I restriction endonuclease subunit R [Caldilinea sp.]
MTAYHDTEEALEFATIDVLAELGWGEHANLYEEIVGATSPVGRESRDDVVLRMRLLAALERINPDCPPQTLDLVADELMRDRSSLSLVNANQEIYAQLKDGIAITFTNTEGDQESLRIQVIDWNTPQNNDFFVAQQMWITGPHHTRRTDLVGYVNGLPLLLFELKKDTVSIQDAFNKNLRDYKDTIPQLFWYNAAVLLSNGRDSRIGSLTADWEHFNEWKRINDEGEAGVIALDTMLRAICPPDRLLDIVENFTLFSRGRGETAKVLTKNHQYLGVNNAIEAVRNIRENQGRLGVFWHTQGSGKSFSMVFLAQKIFRRIPGNWTFVIITDRRDLDDQIYKTFAATGTVTEQEKTVRAQDGEHLQQLLQEDHRYVFTLIQKFHIERGRVYPTLSDRDDIIVITDEAHRSQYDILAQNMRNALPNAAFIGFTGTPLIAGEEEKTRDLYGDYVSIYNFRQSIADNATVPLFYENRVPEVQLLNEQFSEELEELLEEAELSEEAEERLARQFRNEYGIITDDERLERIAEDIVQHFLGRGFQGKAMVVSIDKVTAGRMYDKVQKYWQRQIAEDKQRLEVTTDEAARQEIETRLAYMNETDKALIVSQGQNEIAQFKKKGLDIVPHRERMNKEPLDEYFKDPAHPLRIVFVCAMWMTGFDVPSCSTIYLDKPMRNHTLMQTIARANRVYEGKSSGLIVDYIGIFRNLERALAIYAAPTGDGDGIDRPIKAKEEQVEALRAAISAATEFCTGLEIDIVQLESERNVFARVQLRQDAVNKILATEETKQRYLALALLVERLFKAILPDPAANEFTARRAILRTLVDAIDADETDVDLSVVMGQVEALLSRSIYVLPPAALDEEPFDLSTVDFDVLKAKFAQGRKNIEATKLRGNLNTHVRTMVRLNPTRLDYQERLQAIIDEYNAGRIDVDEYFARLMAFGRDLQEEEQRAIVEQLSEEELALFDIIMKPGLDMTKKEIDRVKRGARELLLRLKQEKLVLDWRKRQQSRADVRLTVEQAMDRFLPPSVEQELFARKVDQVYNHVFDKYYGDGKSVYAVAA